MFQKDMVREIKDDLSMKTEKLYEFAAPDHALSSLDTDLATVMSSKLVAPRNQRHVYHMKSTKRLIVCSKPQQVLNLAQTKRLSAKYSHIPPMAS